jgi:hypothetical protein
MTDRLRSILAVALALAAGAAIAPVRAADEALSPEADAAYAKLRQIEPESEGHPQVVKKEDPRIKAFGDAALAFAKEGTAHAANALIDRLDDRIENIYVDHAAHYAIRDALIQVPAGSKGDAELKRRLKAERSWTKQIALMWVVRQRGPDPEVDATLRSLMKSSPKVPVQRAATKALGVRRCGAAVEDLIEVLGAHEADRDRAWLDARDALHAATGWDRDSAKAWHALWKEKAKAFEAGTRGNDLRFFPSWDAIIPGERVVIAIDTSSSLHVRDALPAGTKSAEGGPPPVIPPGTADKPPPKTVCPECGRDHGPGTANAPPERARIQRGKDACVKICSLLNKKAKFNVIRFDAKVVSWCVRGQLIASGTHAVESAKDWLEPVSATGNTRMAPALELAFATEDLDLLYIITDGAPTEDVPNTNESVAQDEVVAKLRVLNRYRQVRIYGIGYKQVWSALLDTVSGEHGGRSFYLE